MPQSLEIHKGLISLTQSEIVAAPLLLNLHILDLDLRTDLHIVIFGILLHFVFYTFSLNYIRVTCITLRFSTQFVDNLTKNNDNLQKK